MREQWKQIPGWEGYYEASDLGRIRGVDRIVQTKNGPQTIKGKLLQPASDGRTEHMRVNLHRPGVSQTQSVHRLVLLAFRGAPEQGQEGCHFDDNPKNNRLSNLRWGTRSENTLDKVRNGKHHNAQKSVCKHGHALDGANVKARGNKRGCRACDRAFAYISRHPEFRDQFQSISDRYFSLV